jgi:hypothetical protein
MVFQFELKIIAGADSNRIMFPLVITDCLQPVQRVKPLSYPRQACLCPAPFLSDAASRLVAALKNALITRSPKIGPRFWENI